MPILDSWFRDMPQQFLGLPKIEALISAFARQLQEVERVFLDLNEKTDLETATGLNLDYIGTIIPLSRKEAGVLAGADNPEYVMSDDRYRLFLKYKRLVNTNECTYYDIMEGLRLLWNVFPVYYAEDPEHPATIILTLPLNEISGTPIAVGEVPMVKPAGVGLRFRYLTKVAIAVEAGHTAWTFDYEFSGTKPEVALIGDYPGNGGISAVTELIRLTATRDFSPSAETDGTKSGQGPYEIALAGRAVTRVSAVELSRISADTDFVMPETSGSRAGLSPESAAIGEIVTRPSAAVIGADSHVFEMTGSGTTPETANVAESVNLPSAVGTGTDSYHFEHEQAGTAPEIALQGVSRQTDAVSGVKTERVETDFPASQRDGVKSGAVPEIAANGVLRKAESVTQSQAASVGVDFVAPEADGVQSGLKPEIATESAEISVDTAATVRREHVQSAFSQSGDGAAGLRPETAEQAGNLMIDAGAGIRAESFRVDYKYCGTGLAQS